MRTDIGDRVWLSAGPEAVDASLLTKDVALPLLCERYDLSSSRIGVIGNGVNDLPMLRAPGIGIAGAPADAQAKVLEEVRSLASGWISEQPGLDGFLAFYRRCESLGIGRIVADRDGVLYSRGDQQGTERLARLLEEMGRDGRPAINILTGASVDDNRSLLAQRRIAEALRRNPQVERDPLLVLAENGALALDVVSGEVEPFVEVANRPLLRRLKEEFEPRLLGLLGLRLRGRYGLEVAVGGDDRLDTVVVSEKATMVTVVVPGELAALLDPPAGDAVVSLVLDGMIEVAETLGLVYRVL